MISPTNHNEVTAVFAKHRRVLVSFSGGEDSLVLAHMLDPYKDRFDLVWANTGAMLDGLDKNWPAIMNALDGEWGNPGSK